MLTRILQLWMRYSVTGVGLIGDGRGAEIREAGVWESHI